MTAVIQREAQGKPYKDIIHTIKYHVGKHDELLIFSMATAIEIIFGLIMVYKYGNTVFDADAIAYLYNARIVLDKGEYSGLAPLVGTWLPLFPMGLVPLVIINKFYTTGLAGTIVNAFMTGGISVYLYRLLGGKGNRFALLAPVLFLSNIYVLIFGAIPMSEQSALFFITASAYYFKKYLDTGMMKEYLKCSVTLIFGTFTRYEIWVVVIYVVAVYLIKEIKNKTIHRAGYALVSFTGMGAWLIINYLIHHDAFWFNKNPMGVADVNSISVFSLGTYYFKNSLYLALNHAWIQMSLTFGILLYLAIVSVVLLIVMGKSKDLLPLAMFIVPVAVNIFLMYKGASMGWQRYFYATVPAVVLLNVTLLENVFWILIYFNPVKAIKTFLNRKHYIFEAATILIIGVTAVAAFSSNAEKMTDKSSEVSFSKEDAGNRPWIFQGLDISNRRIAYKIEYNGSVYRGDLDFGILRGMPIKSFNKVKRAIGTEKLLMPYEVGKDFAPNVFSVTEGIPPSQIIDDFNYRDYENIMIEPWKYQIKYVLMPLYANPNAVALVNKWYHGNFYLYNYYQNETWRSSFLDRYEPVLSDEEFKLFKLKAGT